MNIDTKRCKEMAEEVIRSHSHLPCEGIWERCTCRPDVVQATIVGDETIVRSNCQEYFSCPVNHGGEEYGLC